MAIIVVMHHVAVPLYVLNWAVIAYDAGDVMV